MCDLEQDIRDTCYAELEAAVSQERRRWQAALDNEVDNQQAHLDRKVDVVIRATKASMGVKVYEDGNDARVEELERENEVLRRKVEGLEREVEGRSGSPVKGKGVGVGKKVRVLKSKRWEDPEGVVEFEE